MEMVSSGEIDHVHISFMVAGYTKFAPDRLFSVTGSAYKREDVFTIHELKALCGQSATTFITDGQQVLTWRDSLGDKYSDLPGVRKLHDFLVVKAHNGDVVMKVRKNCFTGVWKDSPLRVRDSTAIGVPTDQPTVTPTFTAFQPRKRPTWSPCMTVSFLWIVVQITCQPARQHQLSLLLQHQHL